MRQPRRRAASATTRRAMSAIAAAETAKERQSTARERSIPKAATTAPPATGPPNARRVSTVWRCASCQRGCRGVAPRLDPAAARALREALPAVARPRGEVVEAVFDQPADGGRRDDSRRGADGLRDERARQRRHERTEGRQILEE